MVEAIDSKCVHKHNFRVLTPRDNAKTRKCSWCGGGFVSPDGLTKGNEKYELIASKSGEKFGTSTGVMCDDCRNLLLWLPKDYWVSHAIWSRKCRAAIEKNDDVEWDRVYSNPPKGVR